VGRLEKIAEKCHDLYWIAYHLRKTKKTGVKTWKCNFGDVSFTRSYYGPGAAEWISVETGGEEVLHASYFYIYPWVRIDSYSRKIYKVWSGLNEELIRLQLKTK
jgi:hypothetical protein